MANGAFKFKDNSGNVVSYISGSGQNIYFSGGTLNLSGMSAITLGNTTLIATSASYAGNYLLTSSFNSYTGTTNASARLMSIETKTGSFATTGSNVFKGDQTFSGSLVPSVDGLYDLGDPTHQFRHLYLSSASLYIDGTKVLGSTTQELQITTDDGQSFKILESGSDNITLQSADGNIEIKTSGGGDVILDPNTGIIALKGSTTVYSGYRILSSDGNNVHFGNGVTISGSLLATGTSLVSGSSQITYSGLSGVPSGIISGSEQITGYGFATTGSNNFQGTQTITGSLYISQNLVVQGSSSLEDITGSNVYIGTNKINLNTDTPAIRFGGLSVFDSGSNFGESGSLLWDSQNNRWLYQHPASSGAPYKSAIIISGPQNSGDLGSESTLTSGKISKAVGDDHIGDSIITETGGGIGIGGSLSITGSIITNGGLTNIGTGIVRNVIETTGGVQEPSLQFKTTLGSYYLGNYPNTSIFYFDNRTGYKTSFQVDGVEKVSIGATGGMAITGSLNTVGSVSVGATTSTFPLNVYTSSANTNNVIAEFWNGDYTSGTKNYIRVRNAISAGSTMSSYFGQGQDNNTYIVSNDFGRGGDIIVNGNTGKTSIRYGLDITGSLATTSNVTIGTTNSGQPTMFITRVGGYPTIKGSTVNGGDGQIVIDGASDTSNVYLNNYVASNVYLATGGGTTHSGKLIPHTNATHDLGSTSNRWSTVYTSDLSMSNGIGDYTIVEGLEDLFLYNNKTNKVFKFMLQEVDPSTATPKKS